MTILIREVMAFKQISIFLCTKTRSASVPREVFGQEQLPGVLVVDRYSGYNKMPCDIQRQAIKVKTEIKALMESPARHMAIKSIQNIFNGKKHEDVPLSPPLQASPVRMASQSSI